MNNTYETYYGIDVSKEWLDVATADHVQRIPQTEEAIKAWVKNEKQGNQKRLAVVESTGGYEQLVVRCLSEEGVVVHVAHPNKVNAFAKARGRLAKTDPIDAQILRDYAAFIQDEDIKAIPTAFQRELHLLGARLEQLKEMHHQECCRLGIASEEAVKESIRHLLALLKAQIKQIQEALFERIQANSEYQEKYAILCSMKGVGPTLAMKLITDLPELGVANKKAIAALVGVAPITQQSGQKTGKAMTRYGRHAIRRVLYMGALVACRHNSHLTHFYQKLIHAGKPKKVAIVAVMRKMIVILNAMIQSKKHFYA